MPYVYSKGDTSYTRCMDMMRRAKKEDLRDVALSSDFIKEKDKCTEPEKIDLRNAYNYYRNL